MQDRPKFLTNEQDIPFQRVLRIGVILIFTLLVIETLIVIGLSFHSYYWGVRSLYVLVPTGSILLIENAIKLFLLKSFPKKIFCYVLDFFLLLLITCFTSGSMISMLYIVILTEFYLSQENLRGNIAMGVCSVVLFLIDFAVSETFQNESFNVVRLITYLFNDLVILTMHFFIVNFTLQIYRKNRKIAEAVEQLNASNEKLRLAGEELKAITLLEERQRIAKEIHDTAGHSITTVIMQTEAAGLAIENDPESARQKIISANLQAKHALEELRESVHLLSGRGEMETLKDALLSIIQQSTDGTGITIRSDIDEMTLSDERERFFRNTLKEGISNGLRHGGATAFYFELKWTDEGIRFLLTDNGSGMTRNEFKEGFGLSGMRRHTERLGGTIAFETEPDEGFEIHILLPYGEEKEKE